MYWCSYPSSWRVRQFCVIDMVRAPINTSHLEVYSGNVISVHGCWGGVGKGSCLRAFAFHCSHCAVDKVEKLAFRLFPLAEYYRYKAKTNKTLE